MHGALLNSAAFAKYGYKDGMPTPPGGVIVRKPGTQDLQGLVMESACLPVFSQLPSTTPETEVAAAKAGPARVRLTAYSKSSRSSASLPSSWRSSSRPSIRNWYARERC